ncbi:hypothetical protein PLICRDRAFT_55103 [Plicaturopsis crispa FD-325 SS-3]|nr:hypothetical protein PLICRDRAFT_55103 [Plicaturopsis crispa FD-325 SS-3]
MATNYHTRIKSLGQLAQRIDRTPPGEVTPATIAPIFPYLSPARIPTSVRPSPADRRQVKLTNAALSVLIVCGPAHFSASPALVARLLAPDGWPHIWKWMQFEYDKCIVEGAYGDEGREGAVFAIAFTLAALGKSSALRATLTRTPGLLVILAKQWLQARPPELASQTAACAFALEILVHFGNQLETEDDTHLLDDDDPAPDLIHYVLDAAEGDATLVATTALTRLRAAMAAAAVEEVDVNVLLIRSLSWISCRPLHLAFVNHGVIPEVIKVLYWCNARPVDAISVEAILACYYNILNGFFSANGSAWAMQAFDSGLLTAMLKSGAWLSLREHPDLVEFIRKLLCELLPKYLVFRSVLRAVRKPIRQVKRLGLTTAASAGLLWDAWKGFQELAEERLSLLDAWDKEGGRSALQACSRSECVKYDDDTMKRCSGCLGPLYCSKECQRLDWPLHKHICKEVQQSLIEGFRMQRDELDVSFIEYIASHIIYRHIPNVMKGAIDAGILISTLYLEIDYTVVPTAVRVKRVSDYRPPARESEDEWEWQHRMRCAEESAGKWMAMRIIIPQDEADEQVLLKLIHVANALVRSAVFLQSP